MLNYELPFTEGMTEKVPRPVMIAEGIKWLLHNAQLHTLWERVAEGEILRKLHTVEKDSKEQLLSAYCNTGRTRTVA